MRRRPACGDDRCRAQGGSSATYPGKAVAVDWRAAAATIAARPPSRRGAPASPRQTLQMPGEQGQRSRQGRAPTSRVAVDEVGAGGIVVGQPDGRTRSDGDGDQREGEEQVSGAGVAPPPNHTAAAQQQWPHAGRTAPRTDGTRSAAGSRRAGRRRGSRRTGREAPVHDVQAAARRPAVSTDRAAAGRRRDASGATSRTTTAAGRSRVARRVEADQRERPVAHLADERPRDQESGDHEEAAPSGQRDPLQGDRATSCIEPVVRRCARVCAGMRGCAGARVSRLRGCAGARVRGCAGARVLVRRRGGTWPGRRGSCWRRRHRCRSSRPRRRRGTPCRP